MKNIFEKIRLLVIIPAYNEEESIQNVILDIFKNTADFFQVECLVVNDGSIDNTSRIARDNNCTVINHLNKRGVGAALRTGLNYAFQNKYEFVVNIDADGQFNSLEINDLIRAIITERADLVVGNRFAHGVPENMPLLKYYGNLMMNFFIGKLIGEKVEDVSCGFRAYSKKAIIGLSIFNDFTYTQEMFIDAKFKGLKIVQIPVSVVYFKDRISKIANNLIFYAYKTCKIIIRTFVYYKPLKFFGVIGILFNLFGGGLVFFMFFVKLTTGRYTPYKAFGFMGASTIFFGLITISIGLLADSFSKSRRIQEEILYYEKERKYEK